MVAPRLCFPTKSRLNRAVVRGKAAGEYLMQNKLAKTKGRTCGVTALERGALCTTMKNMLPNLNASSLDVESISAHPRHHRLKPSLYIKMSTPFLCVVSCDGRYYALI